VCGWKRGGLENERGKRCKESYEEKAGRGRRGGSISSGERTLLLES
jgi:hypothetical protein